MFFNTELPKDVSFKSIVNNDHLTFQVDSPNALILFIESLKLDRVADALWRHSPISDEIRRTSNGKTEYAGIVIRRSDELTFEVQIKADKFFV